MNASIRLYAELAKSGIVTLVLISVLGGYLLGQSLQSPLDLVRCLLTLMGVLGLASGSSALNQIQDIAMDARMPRTAGRPLPSGRLSLAQAWTFSLSTMAIGLVVLAWLDSTLMWMGVGAVISYNFLYTLWWKRKWALAAIPGAVPGALPIWMGFVAADGSITSPGGIYLFALLFFWQMPHFWVLALRYTDDYRNGGVPTLPVAKGGPATVRQIVAWGIAYAAIGMAAPLFFKLGMTYWMIASAITLVVLWELARFAKSPEGKAWLRFFLWVNFSLIAYIGAAAVDLWSVLLIAPFTRDESWIQGLLEFWSG